VAASAFAGTILLLRRARHDRLPRWIASFLDRPPVARDLAPRLSGISEIARQDGLLRLWIESVAIPAEKAAGPSRFRPALRFRSLTVAGLHFLMVLNADPATSRDAR
jgi:hypothetical protein